jgi:ABC-type transporter Mla subunit MlaD
MRNLSSPRSELRNLIPALGAAAAEVAPVAEVQAQLFADLGDTFAALNRNPAALQQTIEETPPTLEAATASFRVQTPFLARFADVSRRLQPGVAELPQALPLINGALAAGVPAFEQTPELSDDLEDLFEALDSLSENPNTLLALKDLRRAVQVSKPALVHVAPYQTVCNNLVYFFNPLGTHLSDPVPGGTQERIKAKIVGLNQPNTLGSTQSKRPVDVPSDQDPNSTDPDLLQALHGQTYGPAIDSQGRADCQTGQTGYPNRLVTDPRWPAAPAGPNFKGGGSHVVVDSNTPGRAGGTYKSRELGIDSLKDVP